MAAFLLFVLAVAGGILVADLVGENTTAGQVTVFHHTVTGYPEGWLLAVAAGLGVVIALLLVASVNSTKRRRARREQLGRLRRGLEDQAVAPKPDHARLLDEFFGPEEPSGHLGGPARPADLKREGREGRADDHQRWVPPQPIQHPTEPLYQQARSAHVREEGREGRAEDSQRWVPGERVEYPPEPLYEQARRAAGLRQDSDLPVAASTGAPAVAVRVEVHGGKQPRGPVGRMRRERANGARLR
jgi:hypothetical protein